MIMTEQGWMYLHTYNWLQAGNIIPEGHVLKFIDDDFSNPELSNLKLTTRREIMQDACALKPTKPKKEKPAKAPRPKGSFTKTALMRQAQRERQVIRLQLRAQKADENREEKRQARIEEKQRLERLRGLARKQKEVESKWEAQSHSNRKREKVFKTKVVDYSKLQSVRIDHRTVIYAKPGQDINSIIQRYKKSA
jgi:hypothetical protein